MSAPAPSPVPALGFGALPETKRVIVKLGTAFVTIPADDALAHGLTLVTVARQAGAAMPTEARP